MAVALSGTSLTLGLVSTMNESLDLKSRSSALNFARGFSLDNGTGANQADKVWDDTRTLTASANEDLDFAGTTLQDAFGANITFVKVKAILVAAYATNTNNVVIKPGAANGFLGPFGAATHTITIPPGGFAAFGAPASAGLGTVVAATGDLFNVANGAGGTSVTYDIVVLGTSA